MDKKQAVKIMEKWYSKYYQVRVNSSFDNDENHIEFILKEKEGHPKGAPHLYEIEGWENKNSWNRYYPDVMMINYYVKGSVTDDVAFERSLFD